MLKTIVKASLALALAMGGSATMLGGTALASTGAGHATAPAAIHGVGTVPAACTYTYVINGHVYVIPFCPAAQSNGGTATNNCNANCSASAVGTKGSNH